MPYRDPEQQRAYNRRWHRERLELCPLCANLKTPGCELCQECRSHQRMVAAELRERDVARKVVHLAPEHREATEDVLGPRSLHVSRSRSSGRPQPPDHPWRKSLTRTAAWAKTASNPLCV